MNLRKRFQTFLKLIITGLIVTFFVNLLCTISHLIMPFMDCLWWSMYTPTQDANALSCCLSWFWRRQVTSNTMNWTIFRTNRTENIPPNSNVVFSSKKGKNNYFIKTQIGKFFFTSYTCLYMMNKAKTARNKTIESCHLQQL